MNHFSLLVIIFLITGCVYADTPSEDIEKEIVKHIDMEQAQADFYFAKPWWERDVP